MKLKLKVGDWVEVRSKEEILRTLDGNGQLDGTPFMPEMFQYCGKRFQVHKRAHKTCDYTSPYPYHTRRLADAVHLNTRCNGEAHDGCQAACLLYWKHAWLKPLAGDSGKAALFGRTVVQTRVKSTATTGCEEASVWNRTRSVDRETGACLYVCQATQIPNATTPLAWWDVRQYWEDFWSGNVRAVDIFAAVAYSCYYHLSQSGLGVGRMMRWLYDRVSPLFGGSLFPRRPGEIPEGTVTPTANLNLKAGDLVRIKPHLEILQTVDSSNRNRGMYWDAELVPYCGGTYHVLKVVTKIIDEKSGKMIQMKTPCVVLDSVVCRARYSPCRLLCPKEMYSYWREIWLDKVNSDTTCPSRAESSTNRQGEIC